MEMNKIIPQLFRKFDFGIGADWETLNHWPVGLKGMKGKVKLRERAA